MKSSDFKRHKSTLRTLQEEPFKKRVNWDRWIYLGILAVVTMLVINYFVMGMLYVTAAGQVRFQKLDVQFTEDIQVTEFYVSPGDEVKQGDTLFKYVRDEWINANSSGGTQGSLIYNKLNLEKDNDSWIERERMATLRKIETNKIEQQHKNQLLAQTKERIEVVKKEVYLNIRTSDELDPLYSKVSGLAADIQQLDSEITYLYRYLGMLNNQTPDKTKVEIESSGDGSGYGSGGGDDDNGEEYYIAPIDGTITQVFIERFEVALQSQQIISIHKPENVFVRAYFSQEDLEDFKENDEVTITFPNGFESKGKILRIYFATYQMPVEFQKKYEPVTRSLAAEIIPLDNENLDQWRKYYKMGVSISKPRYW